ncbi:MAG TPA: class I SAM-dependent methyltransferase [Phycisphaerae bacterium]|nr:class I SAM-dependent methyltransferase [Phycisphaerae bacterium]
MREASPARKITSANTGKTFSSNSVCGLSLLAEKGALRIVDLGAGSGEGLELLTHISIPAKAAGLATHFVLSDDQIAAYVGVDISPAMVERGRANYPGRANVRFEEADLGDGFPLEKEAPFDIYFSSYSSLSHITYAELAALTHQIMQHARGRAYLVYDLFGRFSPEWPPYWAADALAQRPYNMAYLLRPEERTAERIENFPVTYWSAAELEALVAEAAHATGRCAAVAVLKDRSILVGRHMDTGLFNGHPRDIRRAVNCLFERDYRGDVVHLGVDLEFLDDSRDVRPEAHERIRQHHADWMIVVDTYAALAASDNAAVKRLIESARPDLSEELKMLAWVFRNAARFPVVDFWASVMGPQVACVLRNLEYALPRGLGCGHGLLAVVEVTDK